LKRSSKRSRPTPPTRPLHSKLHSAPATNRATPSPRPSARPTNGFQLIEDCASIGPALKALPERDRLILHLRFVEDLTQTEIAQRIGVSQMHVSRLIRRALEQVRSVADPAA